MNAKPLIRTAWARFARYRGAKLCPPYEFVRRVSNLLHHKGLSSTANLRLDPVLDQQPFGAVVPHVHLRDLAAAHDEAVDIAVPFERRSVRPFAIERTEIIDDGLGQARHYVGALDPLFHPLVALGVESRGFAR